jgi:glutaminyl-peptide cyclotransferase
VFVLSFCFSCLDVAVTVNSTAEKVMNHRQRKQQPIVVTQASGGWNVARSFPHDSGSFTQGLFFRAERTTACAPITTSFSGSVGSTGSSGSLQPDCGAVLYESTGIYGQSSVRRVCLATGTVLAKIDLPSNLFGEGLALLPLSAVDSAVNASGPDAVSEEEVLYQLTWREKVVRRYSKCALAGLVGSSSGVSSYSDLAWNVGRAEGWGLAYNGSALALSDGGPNIRFVDPLDLAVLHEITVGTSNLNELEFVDGEIWANVWLTNNILVIDPDTGVVRARLDMTGLYSGPGDVLNGIAYDEARRRVFLTGKFWNTLFHVEFPGLPPSPKLPATSGAGTTFTSPCAGCATAASSTGAAGSTGSSSLITGSNESCLVCISAGGAAVVPTGVPTTGDSTRVPATTGSPTMFGGTTAGIQTTGTSTPTTLGSVFAVTSIGVPRPVFNTAVLLISLCSAMS